MPSLTRQVHPAIALFRSPLSITPLGDLLARHVEAQIELRIVRNLWPLIDAIVASGLDFSIIRKANAQPRRA